jgi:hypothetical protein
MQSIIVRISRYDSGERLRFTRADVEQLATKQSEWEVSAVEQAIAKLDYRDAFARVIARVINVGSISTELMAALYPWCRIRDGVDLIALADGDRSLKLLELSEHGRFPQDFEGGALRGLALHAAWILEGEPLRPRITKELYRARERYPGLRGHYHVAIFEELARALREDSLARDDDAVLPEDVRDLRAALSTSRGMALRSVLQKLESVDTLPPLHGMKKEIIHAAPKAGRNEPCPCGSGQKYKRCHGSTDQDAPLPPSTLMADDINSMLFDQLCMLDPKALADAPLSALLDRFLVGDAYARAEQILAVLESRASVLHDHVSNRRSLMIHDAASRFRLDFVQRHIGKLSSADRANLEPYIPLGLALHTRSPDLGERLLEAASHAVKDETGKRAQVLAAHMLAHAPALGILLGRGCMLSREEASKALLVLAEDARAQLGLPPAEDLAVKIHAGLQHEQKARDARKEAEGLRATLQEMTQRVRELERHGLDLEAQLRARAAAASAERGASGFSEPADVRTLREKIETLQARIREGNEERAALRRELAEAGAPSTGAGRTLSVNPDAEPDDDGEAVDDEQQPRRILVPSWSRAGEDGLRAIPPHVATEALRTVADLAAGDVAAWRAVKRPKSIDRSVLLARIGIHHRLLFSVDGDRLQVLEMVSRSGLDVAIKRLRATTG